MVTGSKPVRANFLLLRGIKHSLNRTQAASNSNKRTYINNIKGSHKLQSIC